MSSSHLKTVPRAKRDLVTYHMRNTNKERVETNHGEEIGEKESKIEIEREEEDQFFGASTPQIPKPVRAPASSLHFFHLLSVLASSPPAKQLDSLLLNSISIPLFLT